MKEYKSLWKEKNYVKVMLANIITRLGDGIDMIAFSWLVYEVTGSTVLTASIFGVNMIPNITIGLISGVICQYVSEKTVMFICDIGRCICVSLIAFLFMNQQLEVWHLFVVTFLNSSFEAFRSPCEASIYPKILSEDTLDNGIALKQSLVNGANFLGIVVAPLCIALFGLQGALLIDAFSFILCGLIVLTIRSLVITRDSQMTVKQCFHDLAGGFLYLKKDQFLSKLLIIFCIVNALFVPIQSFQAAYIKDILQMDSVGISIFSTFYLLGNVFMSPFLPRLKEQLKGRKLIVYGQILTSIMMIAYTFLSVFPLSMRYFLLASVSLIVGASICTINYPLQLSLYKRIDSDYQSRIQSIVVTCAMAITPISSFIAGGISYYLSIQTIYICCAIGFLIATIYISLNQLFYIFNKY